MKTEEFPAVLEARKIVAHQMAFYRSMMEDKEPVNVQPQKKMRAHKMSAERKKTSKQQVACTA